MTETGNTSKTVHHCNTDAHPDSLHGRLDIGKGPDVEIMTGYKWADSGMWAGGFRLEGEVGYSPFTVHAWHANGVPTIHTSGRIELVSAFLNAVWDWPIAPKWDFSFGGGIGLANVDPEIHDQHVTPPLTDATNRLAFRSDSAFTWQLLGGLTYEVDPNVDLQLDYRYQGVGDTSHRSDFASIYHAKITNFHVQTVKLSIRWYYCPPEAAASAASPPPPPPPPPKVFIVFFDFDKSNLTAEAQAVVAEAVAAVKAGNVVHVMVTGHTDTVGSHAYNQALSERRAASVKAEMIRLGVPDGEIATVGRSFDEPMVQTGPGVREPQNRRAVIELGK